MIGAVSRAVNSLAFVAINKVRTVLERQRYALTQIPPQQQLILFTLG
jgi:hypothetical protein